MNGRIGVERGDRRGERGVSMVEVVFGLGIAMAVIAAGYTIMTGTEKASTVSDQTAQMQQNARIALELVSRDLQTAGFGFAGPVGNCANAIVPADNSPAGADAGPDSVSVVVPTALTPPLGTLNAGVSGPIPTLTLTAGSVAAFGSDFAVNAVVSVNGAASSTVTGIGGDVLTLTPPLGTATTFPAGSSVYWLRCITYAIGTTSTRCSGNPPCLLRGVRNLGIANVNNDPNMVPLAEGIEDLQLAYACDGCTAATAGIDDGVVDDQNANNTFDTADFISNSTWGASPSTPDRIRLVRVSLVARQIRSDPSWTSTVPVVVEDHNPTADAGYNAQAYSNIRRRLVTKIVQLRNLGT